MEKIMKKLKKTNGSHNSYQQYCIELPNNEGKYFLPRNANSDRLSIISKSQQRHY